MSTSPDKLSLSLISHTNAGKTTLARTLLRRDVGEVLDQAHVTDESSRFVMLELERARKLFRARGWKQIDVSGRAVEENASKIIDAYEESFGD